MTDRENWDERGFLTDADREFLSEPEERTESEGARYNIWRRIRRRTVEAMIDLTFLVEHLPPEEREKVFSRYGEDEEFTEGVIDAFTFLFLAFADSDPSAGKTRYRNRAFDAALRIGVKDACEKLGMLLAEWELEYHTISAEQREQIREHLEAGGSFGASTVALLWEEGEIDQERLREFLLDELDG